MAMRRMLAAVMLMSGLLGCDQKHDSPSAASTQPSLHAVHLTLDWKPEPEFGGFYAAQIDHAFSRHNLDVALEPAGEGAPTWQLVATGKTDFATTAADQVLIANAAGADIVALFAVYQTSPQGIMVHASRHLASIADVFNSPGTLAAEDDTWLHYCLQQFPSPKATIVGYSGGVASFLAKPDYSQQCFITSEPLTAKAQGGDPQTFLVADAGYNPYTTVVIARRSSIQDDPSIAKNLVAACVEGWTDYLNDPSPANQTMAGLNHDMDLPTFTAAATAQKPLIENAETKRTHLGVMTPQRWQTLADELVKLKVISQAPTPQSCFEDLIGA